MTKSKKKKPYSSPELRVYGPMKQLTHVMWWGLYQDRLGKLNLDKTMMMNMMNMMNMS